MFSSSSSECTCAECFRYEANYMNNSKRSSCYKNLRHPLIYYAQLDPQVCSMRAKDPKKTSPNCFVKAFRWYTQAHVQTKPGNLSGFSEWLDAKYDEFVQSQEAVMPHQVDSKRAVIANQNFNACAPLRKKLFARARSPWRKPKFNNNKENGCTLEKCPQTLEYILEPKELNRATSECFQKTSVLNYSKLSATSSETLSSKRTIVVTRYSENNVAGCSTFVPIEVNKNEGVNIGTKPSRTKPVERRSNDKKKEKNVKNAKPSTKEVDCQCSEEKVVKIDVQTQYSQEDISPKETRKIRKTSSTKNSTTKEKEVSKIKDSKHTSINNVKTNNKETLCGCDDAAATATDAQIQYKKPHIIVDAACDCSTDYVLERNLMCSCEVPETISKSPKMLHHQHKCINKTMNSLDKRRPNIAKASRLYENCAQTSDHSIRLGNNFVCRCPILMKIVCPDQFKEGNIRR